MAALRSYNFYTSNTGHFNSVSFPCDSFDTYSYGYGYYGNNNKIDTYGDAGKVEIPYI